ncbi:P2Y purinoceptor 8-like [Engraulis encrasicolus]|uniref:P2Y purinoceptor 8-like n=1 Tax=Engraulis encrasicolus TaxID=184585 RepID=UPI002FD40F7F
MNASSLIFLPNASSSSSSSSFKPIDGQTIEDLQSSLSTLALPIIYLLVFLISTPCNLLCFILLLTRTKRQTSTIILAINLSLADLLYSMALPLQIIYHFSGNDWPFGSVWCGIATVIFHSCMQCSVLLTCAIAVERYLGVVHPLRSKHLCTPVRALLLCLLTWALVLVVQTPYFRHDLTREVPQLNLSTCFDIIPPGTFGSTRTHIYLYFVSVWVLFYAAPLGVLVACYVCVTRELRRSPQTDGEDYSRRYALLMCATAAACFVLCYLPNVLLQAVHLTMRGQHLGSLYPYYKLTHGINSLNCCVDPFVYYLASREFRNTFRRALRPLHCCRRQCDTDELSTPSEVLSIVKATAYTTSRM